MEEEKKRNPIIQGIKQYFWTWVFGLFLILLFMMMLLVSKTDLANVTEYYQEEMERCNCMCPEELTSQIQTQDVFNMEEILNEGKD